MLWQSERKQQLATTTTAATAGEDFYILTEQICHIKLKPRNTEPAQDVGKLARRRAICEWRRDAGSANDTNHTQASEIERE